MCIRASARFVLLLVGLLLQSGCPGGGSVQCELDENCNRFSGGECTMAATGNSWCTYDDAACPSGRRWSDLDVGDGLEGECVADDNADAGVGIDAAVDGGPDVTPPSLVMTSPIDGADDVVTTTIVSATFDEPIDPLSIVGSFTVMEMGGMNVAGQVSADGADVSFVPDGRLQPDEDYVATITTGLTDSAGNPLAAPVTWEFTTLQGEWSSPELLESEQDMRAEELDVAFADDMAVATWVMRSCSGVNCGLDREIWASVYENGTWSAPATMQTSSMRVSAPRAAISADGTALLVWVQQGVTYNSIAAASYDAGWSNSTIVDSEELGSAAFPRVAMDSNGNGFAVWEQSDGTRSNIWASRYTGSWGTDVKIETSAILRREEAGWLTQILRFINKAWFQQGFEGFSSSQFCVFSDQLM